MQNRELAADYVHRAALRLKAIDVLLYAEASCEVVRASQEIVDLALKGWLRACGHGGGTGDVREHRPRHDTVRGMGLFPMRVDLASFFLRICSSKSS